MGDSPHAPRPAHKLVKAALRTKGKTWSSACKSLGLATQGDTMKVALVLGLALLAFSTDARAAGRDRKPNCSVQLIREASAGSIEISFDADSQEECDRAKSPEVQTAFSGPAEAPKAAPAKKKKK